MIGEPVTMSNSKSVIAPVAPQSETAATIKQVKILKESLLKEHEKSNRDEFDPQPSLDLLTNLDALPINLEVLSETLIGTVVSKFKSVKSKDSMISSFAKSLIKKWKTLAKDQLPIDSSATKLPAPTRSAAIASSIATISSNSETWDNLAPNRRNVCVKLSEIFSESSMEAEQSEIFKIVSAVERAIHDHACGQKLNYVTKARQLSFNLKKNNDLRLSVLSAKISPAHLCKMSSEELCSSDLAKQRQEDVDKLRESRRLDWDQANEDKINEMCGIKGDLLKASLFTCNRCKSTKTTSTQKQTRSADEPMTVFVLCTNCQNRWKC